MHRYEDRRFYLSILWCGSRDLLHPSYVVSCFSPLSSIPVQLAVIYLSKISYTIKPEYGYSIVTDPLFAIKYDLLFAIGVQEDL